MVDLSLLVPMYNEAEGMHHFFERVEAVLKKVPIESYEIICINDGSADDSLGQLLHHRKRNPAIKIIDLSRNFGKEQALTAGLDAAIGRAIVPMDADLQDPPELLGEFIAKWQEGYEVVYGTRINRPGDSAAKRFTARWFYRVHNYLSDIELPRDTGDFRLLDRQVVEVLKTMPERNRFMKGMFAWVGFRQYAVPYERPARHEGRSRWNYWRLWNFALDAITSFSTAPLRIWSYVGASIAGLAFLYALWLLGRTLWFGVDVPGYASLMAAVLFMGGLQLFTLGIMGEYIGRLYLEAKGRPVYVVRQSWGI
jgi:glycosyltransferase involved in cell wall biosynthesis